MTIKPGDRVKYSRRFLEVSGQAGTTKEQSRGAVVYLMGDGSPASPRQALVKWEPGHGYVGYLPVAVGNLEIAGD
jgi:hypothetical protein